MLFAFDAICWWVITVILLLCFVLFTMIVCWDLRFFCFFSS